MVRERVPAADPHPAQSIPVARAQFVASSTASPRSVGKAIQQLARFPSRKLGLETAIAETVFHFEGFARDSADPPRNEDFRIPPPKTLDHARLRDDDLRLHFFARPCTA
jgi:hypothetical protein